MTAVIRAKRTDTGLEFGLEADCFLHGSVSHRIGLSKNDCPFQAEPASDFWQSWILGWETAHELAKRRR